MELIKVVENVLAGKQEIVSHDGTGQYQATSESTSVGTSACGLAALNCAKQVFRLYQDPDDNSCCGTDKTDSKVVHDRDRCLLYRCLSRQATEVGAHHSSWIMIRIIKLYMFRMLWPYVRHGQPVRIWTSRRFWHCQYSNMLLTLSRLRMVRSTIRRSGNCCSMLRKSPLGALN